MAATVFTLLNGSLRVHTQAYQYLKSLHCYLNFYISLSIADNFAVADALGCVYPDKKYICINKPL